MEYRGTKYTVVQDISRDAWIWTVHLDERTTESGLKKTREGALTAVLLTIDRWCDPKKGQRQCSGIATSWQVPPAKQTRSVAGRCTLP